MPTYEYHCNQCGQDFSLIQSIAEHDLRTTRCPHCGSDQVVQKVSHFTAQTSKKS